MQHAFVEKRIDEAIEGERQRKISQVTEGDPNHRYILLREMVKLTQDKLDLRSQIISVFMPSPDTTGFSNGQYIPCARSEPCCLDETTGRGNGCCGKSTLTFELLKSIKYLQWIINESQCQFSCLLMSSFTNCYVKAHRMYSISEYVPRNVLSNSVLPTGGGPDSKSPLLVCKGNYIVCNMYCLHHDETIWGPDVDLFAQRAGRA